jgi:biopolymer transport protein ExbB/TolQ
MYAPALILLLAAAVAIERWRALATIGANPGAVAAVLSVLQSCCDVAAGVGFASRMRGGSARIAGAGLRHLAWPIEHVRAAMAEARTSETARARRRVDFLRMLAAVAALSGTLGAFVGVFIAMGPVGGCDASDKFMMMRKGLSEAYVSLAFGLGIAMFILVLHALLAAYVRRLEDRFEIDAVELARELSLLHPFLRLLGRPAPHTLVSYRGA